MRKDHALYSLPSLQSHPKPTHTSQQSAKQKAVLDLLRELRQQGLGAGATPALRALRDPVALAHAPAPFALEGLLVLPSPTSNGAFRLCISRSARSSAHHHPL